MFLLGLKMLSGYFAGRGLITIHADKRPLSEITRSIGKQAGTLVQANFDPKTPVTMHVDKVPLGEALKRSWGHLKRSWGHVFAFMHFIWIGARSSCGEGM